MTRVLHRAIAHSYPVAVSGSGIHIRDATGKEYIDASGGAAVSCLGHSHPDVLPAMHGQLDKLAYAHTSFFTTQVAEESPSGAIGRASTASVSTTSGASAFAGRRCRGCRDRRLPLKPRRRRLWP